MSRSLGKERFVFKIFKISLKNNIILGNIQTGFKNAADF
jgi:hypothetical protein